MLDEFIPKLNKELELKGFGAPGQESYGLLLDDTNITISGASSGIQFIANLGDLPSEEPELFFVKMLRGNLFGQATAEAFLGLDNTSNKIILTYYYPYKLDYRNFKEKLEDFINSIDFWKQEMKSHSTSPQLP